MKTFYVILVLVFSLGLSAEEFGGKIQLKDKTNLETLVTNAQAGEIKNPVLVEARVEKVCKASGCWMTLNGPKQTVRVTFKDYGFFVPSKLEGKTVLVEGEVKIHKMSLKETKHYVKDAGGDPDKVTEAQTEVRMVATAVKEMPSAPK